MFQGSVAAWFQSAHGITAGFSFLQGAAMGGGAAGILQGTVAGVSAAAAGAAELFKWRGNNTT